MTTQTEPPIDLLLVQIRQPNDPMASHERECVVRRAGAGVRLSTRNIFTDPPRPSWTEDYRAIIIGGSGDYSVHDPRSATWVTQLRGLLDTILTRNTPTLGICFGHQLLAYHLGAAVNTDANHAELGTTTVTLNAEGRRDPLMSDFGPTFDVHTGHSDHVGEVPESLQLLASNDALPTQIFRVKGAPIYTTQFHPDLSGAEATDRYVAYHRSLRPLEDAAPPSSLFRVGRDESTRFIRRFLERYAIPT
ncbi:MAG: type 1 glutamine amidotransferase [Polyangiaceae bacterium]